MKRFWKLLSLVLISFVVIGAFFIQGAASNPHTFQIGLKDIEGNRKVLEDTVIVGSAYLKNGYDQFDFKISQDVVEYEHDGSFLDQLDGTFYKTDKIQHYLENYRNFMRGKTDSPYLFYENEKNIVYASDHINYNRNDSNQSIEISRLNKETGQIDNFSHILQLSEYDNYLYVRDVYYDDQMLTILVQQLSPFPGTNKKEHQLYIWNFETETMDVEGTNLHFPIDSEHIYVNTMQNSASFENTDHTGFLVHTGDGFNEFGELEGIQKTHFFILDYETLKMKVIDIPSELSDSKTIQGLVSEDSLFIYHPENISNILSANLAENEPTFSPVFSHLNIETKEAEDNKEDVEEDVLSNPEISDFVDSYSFAEVHDDKLYFVSLSSEESDSLIEVFDLNTLDKLYTGMIDITQPEGVTTSNQFEFRLKNLNFKK